MEKTIKIDKELTSIVDAGTELSYEISFDEQELQKLLDLKQNITDNALLTSDKTIVGAINEINNKQPQNVTNDVMVNFIHIPLTNNSHGFKLNLKIIIVKNGVQSAWSLTTPTISTENPKFEDLGTNFYCYEIGKPVTIPTPIEITGSWGLGTQLINNYRGFTYQQVSETQYAVIFFVPNNAVNLLLNISTLVPTATTKFYATQVQKFDLQQEIYKIIKSLLDK